MSLEFPTKNHYRESKENKIDKAYLRVGVDLDTRFNQLDIYNNVIVTNVCIWYNGKSYQSEQLIPAQSEQPIPAQSEQVIPV